MSVVTMLHLCKSCFKAAAVSQILTPWPPTGLPRTAGWMPQYAGPPGLLYYQASALGIPGFVKQGWMGEAAYLGTAPNLQASNSIHPSAWHSRYQYTSVNDMSRIQ